MHEARSLVTRLIQPAPENGVGVQGDSLSHGVPIETSLHREDERVRLTIKLGDSGGSPRELAWLMQ